MWYVTKAHPTLVLALQTGGRHDPKNIPESAIASVATK